MLTSQWSPMAGSNGNAYELRVYRDGRHVYTLACLWHGDERDGYTWSGQWYSDHAPVGPRYRYTSREAGYADLLHCPGCGSAAGAWTILHASCEVCEGAHDPVPTVAGMARFAAGEEGIAFRIVYRS